MIRHQDCVIVTCDRCHETSGYDYDEHYESEQAAKELLTTGRFKNASYNDDLWRWDDNGQVCASCQDREREDACDGHDYDFDYVPPREGVDYWFAIGQCTKCGKFRALQADTCVELEQKIRSL